MFLFDSRCCVEQTRFQCWSIHSDPCNAVGSGSSVAVGRDDQAGWGCWLWEQEEHCACRPSAPNVLVPGAGASDAYATSIMMRFKSTTGLDGQTQKQSTCYDCGIPFSLTKWATQIAWLDKLHWLRPWMFLSAFLKFLSHRIFRHMHRVLNID